MQLQEPTAAQLHVQAFAELMKGVYTAIPGHVLAFDPDNQRAQIQVGILRVDINGATYTLPPIINVPVFFQGDEFVVETQIDPNCEGMIFFSQRCTDGWKNTGGVADNPLANFHDMQDAFFLPGFRSLPNVITDFSNNGIRLRNKSGNQFAWLKNDGSIALENGAGHIRMASNGVVTINGVTISTAGAVVSPNTIQGTTVTGTVNMFYGGKNALLHTHIGSPTAPNGPVSNTGTTV